MSSPAPGPTPPTPWRRLRRRAVSQVTTQHFSGRQVVALFTPILISQAFSLAFIAISPILIAPAGIEAISAVSTIEFLNIVVQSVFIALGMAGSVLVAQARGRRDAGLVRRAASGTVWAAVLPAVLISVCLLLTRRPVLDSLLGVAGGRVIDYAGIYLTGAVISYPMYALVESAAATLRGVARTRPALYLTLTQNVSFLVLAAVSVRGIGMGVEGLAVSAVASRAMAAVLAILLLRRDPVLTEPGGRTWRPQRRMVWRVLVIGTPFVIEQVYFNGGKLLTQFFIVTMGTDAIATNAIATSLNSFLDMVPGALSVALIPIVGQAIGAGCPADARRIVRSFAWLAVLASAGAGAVMYVTFDWWLGLFDTPQAYRGDLLAIFVITVAGRLAGWWAMSYLTPSGLRAAGDARFTSATATVSMTIRVLLIWLVALRLGYGVVGVWSVMVAEWGLRSLVFTLRFRRDTWTQRSFVRADAAPA